jgi:hypothetical protein
MAIIIIQIKRNYPWNMKKNKFISSLIVIVLMNIFNPFSVLGFENEIEKSKYINKVDSSKIFETKSPDFPKLYSENLITQQNSSANLNLNQAIENFDKAEELIFKAFREFKKGKRYLRSSKRAFNQGNSRIIQTKIQSRRANKYFEKSEENYAEGLNYLRNALNSYTIFLEDIN